VFLLCFVVGNASAQDNSSKEEKKDPREETWKKEKELLKYKKKPGYRGPDDWYSDDPSDIRDNQYVDDEELQRRMYGGSSSYGSGGGSNSGGSYGSGRGTMRYQPQQIQRQRRKVLRGFNKGGSGNLKEDPEIDRPDRNNAKPRVRPRRRSSGSNSSSSSSSTSSSRGSSGSGFWRVLLIILAAAAGVLLIYFLLKNKKPQDTKVIVDVEDEWNPEVVTKTELELKLEAAMEREDFRECVRIYFTFILKELIKKGWIRWKKEKTNHHYVMEMGGRDGSIGFMECVRIYDLVWYGEYQIDRDIFEMLQPTLLNYYKSLDPTDE